MRALPLPGGPGVTSATHSSSAAEGALTSPVGLLLPGEAGLFLLQPRRVVTLPRNAEAAVEFEDPSGHVVEEIPVVGDGHDGPRILLQGPLQPGDRLGVEMVGGLVEQQQVGLESRSRQRATRRRSPPDSVDIGVAGREPQGIHGDLELAVEIPGTRGVDAVLQMGLLGEQLVEVGVGVAHRRAHLVEAHQQRLDLRHPVGDVARHVLGRVEVRLLGEVANGESGGEAGVTAEAVVGPGHDPQQRRLAGAVGADHTDLGPRVEGEVDPPSTSRSGG